MKLSFKNRNRYRSRLSVWPACALFAVSAIVQAQEPSSAPAAAPASGTAGTANKSKSTAQIEAGEPRADTAPANAARADTAPADTGRPGTSVDSPSPSPAAPGAATPGAATPGALSPGAPAAHSREPVAGRTSAGGAQKAAPAVDRLDLGTATVTGDREQPKVMYIVPWKKSDIGDLSGKPMNSLLDEALAPVDRDEFKREVVYYGIVNSDGSGNGAPNKGAQGSQGEK